MKSLLLTLLATFFAASPTLAQEDMTDYMKVGNVSMIQSKRNQDVIVNYTLENAGEPVYVMLDIRTNGTSIGLNKIQSVSGDISTVTHQPVSTVTTNKTITWKARQDWRGHLVSNAEAYVLCYYTNNVTSYMVIDLSAGSGATSYPVSYTPAGPDPLTDPSCASNHLWLKKIEAGTFVMGTPESEIGHTAAENPHTVNLTNDFYIGIFPVTLAQYLLVMGSTPATHSGPAFGPVNGLNYIDIRGAGNWPSSKDADGSTFIGKIRSRLSNNRFDLPTDAQWEYACRAGTTGAWNNGATITNALRDANLALLGWYKYSGGKVYNVGHLQPNDWGIYDMHGNITEWCLDWFVAGVTPAGGDNPQGATSGTARMVRGGMALYDAQYCRSGYRYGLPPNQPADKNLFGFRLAMTLP